MDHVVHDLRFDDWRKTLPGPATAPNAKTLVREASQRRAGVISFVKFLLPVLEKIQNTNMRQMYHSARNI